MYNTPFVLFYLYACMIGDPAFHTESENPGPYPKRYGLGFVCLTCIFLEFYKYSLRRLYILYQDNHIDTIF